MLDLSRIGFDTFQPWFENRAQFNVFTNEPMEHLQRIAQSCPELPAAYIRTHSQKLRSQNKGAIGQIGKGGREGGALKDEMKGGFALAQCLLRSLAFCDDLGEEVGCGQSLTLPPPFLGLGVRGKITIHDTALTGGIISSFSAGQGHVKVGKSRSDQLISGFLFRAFFDWKTRNQPVWPGFSLDFLDFDVAV